MSTPCVASLSSGQQSTVQAKCHSTKGLILCQREETGLPLLNKVRERELSLREVSEVLEANGLHGSRLLPAYRRKGAAPLANVQRKTAWPRRPLASQGEDARVGPRTPWRVQPLSS